MYDLHAQEAEGTVCKGIDRGEAKKNVVSAICLYWLSGLEQNQRRNAERARCLKCMKKREEEDVHDSEPDDSSDDDYGNETWYDYT